MVCVILFMANRVTPAFGFGLDNSTLTQVTPIRYLFSWFVTHHCNTYTAAGGNVRLPLDFWTEIWYSYQAHIVHVRAHICSGIEVVITGLTRNHHSRRHSKKPQILVSQGIAGFRKSAKITKR